MRVAVVGATGLVGSKMLEVLKEREFPVTELIPVASERSAGKKINFNGCDYAVITPREGVAKRPDIAIFSAGGDVSREWLPNLPRLGAGLLITPLAGEWIRRKN